MEPPKPQDSAAPGHEHREDRGSPEHLAQAITAVGRGDAGALHALYAASARQLYAICLTITRDRSASEELLPEVYLQIRRKAAGFDALRARAPSWLAAIARTTAIEWCMSRPRAKAAVSPVPADGHGGRAGAPATAAGHDGLVLTNELDAQCEADLKSIYLEGLTYAQAAKERDVPLAALRMRLRRAVLKIRGKLSVD